MTVATYQLDTMLDQVVLKAQIEQGVPPAYLVAQGEDRAKIDQAARTVRVKREAAPKWSQEELEFVRENLGDMTYEEIGEVLGRSATAVKLKQVRKQMPAPSKQPGYLLRLDVAKALGLDCHMPTRWHEQGILTFEPSGTDQGHILRISYLKLCRFVYNPENWPYFRYDLHRNLREIQDPFLAELVARREAKWDDEWWSTGDAAEYWGVRSSGIFAKRILEGKLPGVRWGNWYVKRSDVMALNIRPRGKHRR